MRYKIEVVQEENYLHFTFSGERSTEATIDIVNRIADESRKSNCTRVLVEANMDNPMTVLEGYQAYEHVEKAGFTGKMHVAWVDHNPETWESSKFAETVLQNRGFLNVRLFNSLDEAKDWLLEE